MESKEPLIGHASTLPEALDDLILARRVTSTAATDARCSACGVFDGSTPV
jgi:hypothetical protein